MLVSTAVMKFVTSYAWGAAWQRVCRIRSAIAARYAFAPPDRQLGAAVTMDRERLYRPQALQEYHRALEAVQTVVVLAAGGARSSQLMEPPEGLHRKLPRVSFCSLPAFALIPFVSYGSADNVFVPRC